jgi:hypothetical protein
MSPARMEPQMHGKSFSFVEFLGLFDNTWCKKRKVNEGKLTCIAGFAGQRARVPPDPIPNSEVKPCSVSSCSEVLGPANLGKLAAHLKNKNAGRFGIAL